MTNLSPVAESNDDDNHDDSGNTQQQQPHQRRRVSFSDLTPTASARRAVSDPTPTHTTITTTSSSRPRHSSSWVSSARPPRSNDQNRTTTFAQHPTRQTGTTERVSRLFQRSTYASSPAQRVQQRLTHHRSADASSSAEKTVPTHTPHVRYRVGDPILIANHQSNWANLVNRYGYPPGQGYSEEEQKGPYVYVLSHVKKVHFEEDAEYYTVTRADTGADQRANAEWMVPMRSVRGEAAALAAATVAHHHDPSDQELARALSSSPGQETHFKCLEATLVCLLTPLFWMTDCLYLGVYKPALWLGKQSLRIGRWQANLCLNGASPYSVSMRFTMVNLLVCCSIWYMFIDQARLAFFAPDKDFGLAIVSCIVWTILVLELLCEVFIRPDGYRALLESDKAYAPSTARFINSFHLVFETIALAVFIPEFLCLWTSTYQCGDRPTFSFFHATLLAVLGPTRAKTFYGRAYLALVRLRVFGLVRHWKKMWINNTFIKMKWKINDSTKKKKVAPTTSSSPRPRLVGRGGGHHKEASTTRLEEQKEKDWALVNASNIGTALTVTNSHRALLIMWVIMGIFPLIGCINSNGGSNPVATDMVGQLQATNLAFTNASDPAECQFLQDSVISWILGVTAGAQVRWGPEVAGAFVLSVQISPSRCGFTGNTTMGCTYNGLITSDLCCALEQGTLSANDQERAEDLCAVWANTTVNTTDEELAKRAGVRVGSIDTIQTAPERGNLTLENGTTIESEEFFVVAKFNESSAVRPAALLSFLLQLSVLVCVLGGLSILRADAGVLVLGPLRRMLKIVARYAKNPLAPAATTHKGEDGDTDAESDDEAGSGQLGNFETEQLINAITKIADLLRKCWGVAGAGIISTNLATEEGALAEVFNPTVPGKSVYALFGFAAIHGFDHVLRNLGGEVMILINDVAAVLHGEVYRWGFGDSGQCNKNLGSAFLMVFRIGLVKEVIQKLEQATDVVFSNRSKKSRHRRSINPSKKKAQSSNTHASDPKLSRLQRARTAATERRLRKSHRASSHKAMSLSLESLPGISAFTDRAVIGMLKSFAGIYRDDKLLAWKDDFRLGAGVGAFSVSMIFGMDAGWAVEGAVGSSFKIDATYLSPHVNMAARMMTACNQYGVSILLSQAVQQLMSDKAQKKLRHLDTITVKGSTLKQKIYTYDARHKGVDFFLYARSDEQADLDSERYSPNIWETDQDLRAMRQHLTDDFEEAFNKGRTAYLGGDWPTAMNHLREANNIMVDTAKEMYYLEEGDVDEAEASELIIGDGPSKCLLNFMEKEGGKAPERWNGFRPLLNK